MNNKLIKTEQQYKDVCERIYFLINNDENAIEPDSPEGEEIEFLSSLVEKFEQEHYIIDASN